MSEGWFKLLTYWQDHEGRQTLTFPFMLGALRIPVGSALGLENVAHTELSELLDSIVSHKATDHFLHIYRCENLDKLVLHKIKGSDSPPPGAIPIAKRSGEQNVLFATIASDDKLSQDSLLSILWAEGGQAILQGNFSCRGKLFQKFNAQEIALIARALA